ncbi:hypothetical protein GGI22_004283, partial [Coemansia erecta]
MSAVYSDLACGDGVYCDHPASPIEDLDFDSTGSLTSLDSLLSDAPDSSSSAEDPPVAAASLPFTCVPNTLPVSATRTRNRKRPRTALNPDTPSEGIVTTGAFLTRATLRKLGVVSNPPDPDTIGTGIAVGDRIKVLDLDKTWYTAIALAISLGKVLVHYPFWDHSYNEWVAIDSRRLLYRGKQGLGADDSRQALRMLQSWDDYVDDVDLDSFDFQNALKLALGTLSEGESASTTIEAAFEPSDAETTVPDTPEKAIHYPRGRPKGRHNRRRVGHIKRRA